MHCYRTEIEITSDRYVCLQLPDHLPEGRAIVTVLFLEPGADAPTGPSDDLDREDIEWWEEFEESSDPLDRQDTQDR